MIERLDRRVLGAIEFVNALTGTRVDGPLRVESRGLALVRNRGALYVLREAGELSHHTVEFQSAPEKPASGTLAFTLSIADPERRYLPRTATISLPRKAAPSTDPDSVLVPIAVKLFPAAGLPVGAMWAVLRVRVQTLDKQIGVANALVKLTPKVAGAAAVSAMTDARGEALLAVLGMSPLLPASDEVGNGGAAGNGKPMLVREFSAALRIVLDGAAVRRADASPPWPVPDPDAIEGRLANGEAAVKAVDPPDMQAVKLAAGASRSVVMDVAL